MIAHILAHAFAQAQCSVLNFVVSRLETSEIPPCIGLEREPSRVKFFRNSRVKLQGQHWRAIRIHFPGEYHDSSTDSKPDTRRNASCDLAINVEHT